MYTENDHLPDDLRSTSIAELHLPQRTHNLLLNRDIKTIGQVIELGYLGMHGLYDIGKKQADIILVATAQYFQISKDKLLEYSKQSQNFLRYHALPYEVRKLPIEVLGITSRRILNPLLHAHITTIEDLFISYKNDELQNIRSLGIQGLAIIEQQITIFLQQAELAGGQPHITALQPDLSANLRPLIEVDGEARPDLISLITQFTKAVADVYNNERGFKIIQYYYGLDGGETYTLAAIGDMEGLSRERVRQIKARALHRTYAALLRLNRIEDRSIPNVLTIEADELLKTLQREDPILLEQEICQIIQQRYGQEIEPNRLTALKLLLSVFGFKEITQHPSSYRRFINKAWQIDTTFEIQKVWQALKVICEVLQTEATPLSNLELRMRVNRKHKIELDELTAHCAIKVCPDIELTSANRYQLKFESFHLFTIDRAYRVLAEIGEPLHFREIGQEINRRLVAAGLPATVQPQNLVMQMVADPRFEPISKSGKWKLSQWDHISTQTIVEIIKEFFHLKKGPATIDEIYSYTIKKRPDVHRRSVISFLHQRAVFTRISRSQYALALWGMKPMPVQHSTSMSARLVPAIHDIFENKQDSTMPLGELVHELIARTNINSGNIYSWINRSSIIVTQLKPGYRSRKVARYTGKDDPPR